MHVRKYQLNNPFDLNNQSSYEAWREDKLTAYPQSLNDLIVEVNNPRKLSRAEHKAILNLCRKTNMAIYAGSSNKSSDTAIPLSLGAQFGLTAPDCNMGADGDGITVLRIVSDNWRSSYIPYTNRPIHWHTDGYYNKQEQQICGLLLHCVSPSASGGENKLLDHEIAYIHLRDLNPDYIRALTMPETMKIPPNIVNGEELRPARSGPVFSLLADGNLHMRYTARTQSIEWYKDPITKDAVAALAAFLNSDTPYILRVTLQSGQGLISNNVLHNRSGYDDDEKHVRQLYRLRYYQRIHDT